MTDLVRLQKAIGHSFEDEALCQLALTHRSVGSQNNERLEFLGDSIINHIIAETLFERFPKAHEGELSRMRASLVKGATLAEIAREMSLGEFLLLGPGEKKSGGHRRATILADALEALAGAILLDSDVATCRAIVLEWFSSRLATMTVASTRKDAKTRLQEFLQSRKRPLPEYDLLAASGEEHQRVFQVTCKVKKPSKSYPGEGSSLRKAEQAAAKAALEDIHDSD